jgi:hypothetical protein
MSLKYRCIMYTPCIVFLCINLVPNFRTFLCHGFVLVLRTWVQSVNLSLRKSEVFDLQENVSHIRYIKHSFRNRIIRIIMQSFQHDLVSCFLGDLQIKFIGSCD